MAISDRIRAEAKRTIEGMTKYYQEYTDYADESEELEHRIARIEASMEGCNGLSQEDKVQKTAENVFELTCAQERTYDALRCELKKTRETFRDELKEGLAGLKSDLKKDLGRMEKKIEDSGSDSSAPNKHRNWLTKFVSDHPSMSCSVFVFFLILVFLSGHFELIAKMCGVK